MKNTIKIQVKDLKKMNPTILVQELGDFTKSLDLKYGTSQVKSWDDCVRYLLHQFGQTTLYDDAWLLFEYCLPFTNYRRPDVIVLFEGKVMVLEFKRKHISLTEDVEQLMGYLNYIRNYHDETQKMHLLVEGALILTTNDTNQVTVMNGYSIIKGYGLLDYLNRSMDVSALSESEVDMWINSSYHPANNILKATYKMFINDDLTMIKNIDVKELQNTLSTLVQLTKQSHRKKRLIFLTGVPGAGKTLALLHTLYTLNKDQFNGVFLTGNGPLEKVLSYLLSNKKTNADGTSLIKGVLSYKKTFFNRQTLQPNQHLMIPPTILFDEAQRAWNEKQMGSYRMSEPELILKTQTVAAMQHGFTNVIASIGFGQSIYKGEEDEFQTWLKVIEKPMYADWEIYAPNSLHANLGNLPNVTFVQDLHLDVSIRANFIDTSPFIESVIQTDMEAAKAEYQKLMNSGYYIKVASNLNEIEVALKNKALETGDSFYGLIASSNTNYQSMKNELGHSQMIKQTDSQQMIGEWYFKNCSKLDTVASEFVCQGLELNYPIVYFGGDFLIRNGRWQVTPTKAYEKPETTIRNIYRVLLSRGRIGLYLIIPDAETRAFFEKILITELEDSHVNNSFFTH